MKLKYERFEPLSCLYVRGEISLSQLKILTIGLKRLILDLESPLFVNLTLATIPPQAVDPLKALKKVIAQDTKQTISWITRERALADFPTVELAISRLPGAAARQVGERIKVDDALFQQAEELKVWEEKEKAISGDAQNAQKVIIENRILKEQLRILKESIVYQKSRTKAQVAIPTEIEDIQEHLKQAKETLSKNLGEEVDL